MVLLVLNQILEEKTDSTNYAADILYSLTAKWFFLFMNPKLDETTVILALQLFQKVCCVIEGAEKKFKEGFAGLMSVLPTRFNIIPIYSLLWGIFGKFTLNTTEIKGRTEMLVREIKPLLLDASEFRPIILRLILKVLHSALNEIERVCFITPLKQMLEVDSSGIQSLKSITKVNFDMIRECMDKGQLKEIICSQAVVTDILGILIDLISSEGTINIQEEFNTSNDTTYSEDYLLRLDFTKDSNLDRSVSGNLFVPSSTKSVQFVLKATHHKYPNELRESVNSVLEIIVIVALDSIFDPTKMLQTIDLILHSIPPTSKILRRQLQEFLLLCIMDAVTKQLSRKNQLFDTRVIQNVGKFTIALADYLYQGYFSSRTLCILDFMFFCTIIALKYEQVESQTKGMLRQSVTDLSSFVKGMNKSLLFALNHFNHFSEGTELLLKKVDHNIKIILSSQNTDLDFIKSLTYFMQTYLDSKSEENCNLAKRILKQILLHKPAPVVVILKTPQGSDYKELVDGFSKLLNDDSNVFERWYSEKKADVVNLFSETVAQAFRGYLDTEMKSAKDRENGWAKSRIHYLKKLEENLTSETQLFQKMKEGNRMLVSETHAAEATKKKKYKADYAQMELALESELRELISDLNQEKFRFDSKMNEKLKWRLDFTEADSRIRKKLRRDHEVVEYKSHADATALEMIPTAMPHSDVSPVEIDITKIAALRSREGLSNTKGSHESIDSGSKDSKSSKPKMHISTDNLKDETMDGEWEEVNLEETEYQKIQRLLRRGDHILQTINCARLIGLELVECICLICQHNIYLIDNYFMRSNGEIIDIDDVEKEVLSMLNRNAIFTI